MEGARALRYAAIVLQLPYLQSWSCPSESHDPGEPSNIVITAEIVGQDTSNPDLEYGDGSGSVNFTAVADNASSYVFYFDGVAEKSPSGQLTKRFSKVGVNTYTVVVKANGTGGLSSTETIEVEVFSSFTDEEAENFLSGANIGDSKKWYWQADKDVHVGLGPVTDDYGNGVQVKSIRIQ